MVSRSFPLAGFHLVSLAPPQWATHIIPSESTDMPSGDPGCLLAEKSTIVRLFLTAPVFKE